MNWQTSRRNIPLDRPLVMGILNFTPDSFSDGGRFAEVDAALRHAELMVEQGVDMIDIGGESTRPGSEPLKPDLEIERTASVIEAIAKRFDVPISIDTSKSEVARAAINTGADIINDISGLRFDEAVARIAADSGAGLVLMHSRGQFADMHSQPPVDDILTEVVEGLRHSLIDAGKYGVANEQIVLDIGLGFGKTFENNLELLAKLGTIVSEFKDYPMLAGASRKSFIGKLSGDIPAGERLGGSIAAALEAVRNGANIVRVHDVGPTVQALRVMTAISERSSVK
jgi:dihydropteroate synthase